MTDLVWIGGTTGNWFDPSNWRPAQVPQTGDTATIFGDSKAQLTADPADGLNLSLLPTVGQILFGGSAILLDATNVTFGPNFTITNSNGGKFDSGLGITGTASDQGTISVKSPFHIEGHTGTDVFVNQGQINISFSGALNIPNNQMSAVDGLVALGTFSNSGQINVTGGFQDFASDITGTGSFNIDATGTVITGSNAVGPGQTFNFLGAGGRLFLDPTKFNATISDFQSGSSISSDKPIDSETYNSASHVLSLFSNGQAAGSLNIAGPLNYTTASFAISNDTITTDVPCFCRETRILTPRGEVKVEELDIGDMVVTASGAARAIKWIGRRSYAGPFLHANAGLLPIIVSKGAIAPDVPRRDLGLSPHHALFLDGVLVPAECLVNGISVLVSEPVEAIEYFHIELASHDVILAEGAPAETFVDCDSRGMFHNAREFASLYPNGDAPRWSFCAPRVEDGEALGAIRQKLATRARIAFPEHDGRPVPGRWEAHLDHADRAIVRGWARDLDDIEWPVALEAVIDGTVIGRVLANQYREDVKAAGHRHGRYGFCLGLSPSLSPLSPHTIQVRREADGEEVEGSPVFLAARPARLDRDGRLLLTELVDEEAKAARAADELDEAVAFLLVQASRLMEAKAALRSTETRTGADRRRAVRGRALFIDQCVPTPDGDAGSQAVVAHIRSLLRLGYAVTFADIDNPVQAGQNPRLTELGVRCRSLEEIFADSSAEFEVIYLHRLAAASRYLSTMRLYFPMARIIYGLGDLHHLRIVRQAQIENRPELLGISDRFKEHELMAVRSADAVITHSTYEAEFLARETPEAVVHVVPWSVPARPRQTRFFEQHGIAFIGTYRHDPNIDGAEWLVREIMPLVWRSEPAIQCLLVGGDMPEELHRLCRPLRPGIVPIGHVDDLDTIFDRVRLTVAPLRFGAGVKGKVIDSLAAGVPASAPRSLSKASACRRRSWSMPAVPPSRSRS